MCSPDVQQGRLGPDAWFVYVNDSACRILGYSKEQLLSMAVPDIDPDTPIDVWTDYWKEIKKKGYLLMESRHRTKDGRTIPVEITANYVEFDDNEMICAFARDITDRKNSEAVLVERQNQFRRLVEYIGDDQVYFSLDLEINFLYASPTIANIAGINADEVVGKNWQEIFRISPKSLPDSRRSIEACLWGETPPPVEMHCFSPDTGEPRILNVRVRPVFIHDGFVDRVEGVVRDITERKAMEEQILNAKNAAETANQAKSVFLANMSHEIRTPMSAILGFSQLLAQDSEITPNQKEYLYTINRSGEHLLALINDILEMSKIEAGRITFNPGTFDFSAMLDDMAMMFKDRTQVKNLSFEIECLNDFPRVIKTDEGKVRQVLINLLCNAVKFTDQGGITVRVREEENTGDTVTIVIEVEDTGSGVSEEELDKIFLPFEQTESAKYKTTGTGLGMPISRDYARIMGGDLTVTSEVGQGSLFRFEFKAEPGGEGGLEKPGKIFRVAGMAVGQKRYRILVVDDRETNRKLLIKMLDQIGFITHEATNGSEAVTAFEEWRPDAILMDMQMPGMDGCEATRQIKSTPEGEGTPIFVVSASAMEEQRVEGLTSRADGFIRKPFRAEEIFENLTAAMGIEYTFEEMAANNSDSVGSTMDQLKAAIGLVPADLLDAMKEAVESGDMSALRTGIDQTAGIDETLANGLHALAKNYDYETLLDLLDR